VSSKSRSGDDGDEYHAYDHSGLYPVSVGIPTWLNRGYMKGTSDGPYSSDSAVRPNTWQITGRSTSSCRREISEIGVTSGLSARPRVFLADASSFSVDDAAQSFYREE